MAASAYRRAGFEARQSRDLVFDRLPSSVRERLAVSLASGGAPSPLLVDASARAPVPASRWMLLAAAAVVGEAALWFKGYGDAASALALQPRAYALAHVAAIFALLFAALRAARVRRAHGGAPIPEGRYLFALDLVEVEGSLIRVTDLHTLRRVEARPGKRGPSVVLVFADAHEVTFGAQRNAERVAGDVKAAIDAALALGLTDDLPLLHRLDPFFELRASDDWASSAVDPRRRGSLVLRASLPALAAAALAVALVTGLGLFALRNRLSDDEMFASASEIAERTSDPAQWRIGAYTGVRHLGELDDLRFARARDDVDALEDYLRHEGSHGDEARRALVFHDRANPTALAAWVRRGGALGAEADSLLFGLQRDDADALAGYVRRGGPHAEGADERLFALARASGDPRRFAFYLAHGKRHADEVQSTLLPAAAYAAAMRDPGDLDALCAFARAYPDSPHADEIRALIHAAYADALARFKQANPGSKGLGFVAALLAELEQRQNPAVSVEIRVADGAGIEIADGRLGERYGAEYEPIAPRFDSAALARFQRQLREDLFGALGLGFAHGAVHPGGPDLGVETARPTILVEIEPVITDALSSPRRKLRLGSVRFNVDFHATLASGTGELAWKYTTPGVTDFEALDRSTLGDADEAIARTNLINVAAKKMRADALQQILARIETDL